MIKKYRATLSLDGKPKEVEFETDKLPVEWLWTQYGMTTYISDVKEVVNGHTQDVEEITEDVLDKEE